MIAGVLGRFDLNRFLLKSCEIFRMNDCCFSDIIHQFKHCKFYLKFALEYLRMSTRLRELYFAV